MSSIERLKRITSIDEIDSMELAYLKREAQFIELSLKYNLQGAKFRLELFLEENDNIISQYIN